MAPQALADGVDDHGAVATAQRRPLAALSLSIPLAALRLSLSLVCHS